MASRKIFDYRLIGIIGSFLLIISEFLPWFSEITLFEFYMFTTAIKIEDSFLYIFPLMTGVICLIGCGLVLYSEEYKINSVIINFIGLSFLLLFLFDFIPNQIKYIPKAGLGFYCCIAGFMLVIIDIINVLLTKEKNVEG
ncbi:MAG: hypothetical protein ACTSQJ_05775 [Promethearchaeota archaeon]